MGSFGDQPPMALRMAYSKLAQISLKAPRVPWDEFITEYFHWRQGQHLGIIGPTGSGKTNLMTALLPLHQFVVVFATKPMDITMSRLISHGYLKMEKWQRLDARDYPRRVLWPNASSLDSEKYQREIFNDAFHRIYREKGWTLVIDELWYIINVLRLDKAVKTYLLQARSLGISLVALTQRPAWVPVEVYDQSDHLFFYRDNDEKNLSRIGGISWRSAALIREIVANLEPYQFLYVNTRSGNMVRSRAPKTQFVEGNVS